MTIEGYRIPGSSVLGGMIPRDDEREMMRSVLRDTLPKLEVYAEVLLSMNPEPKAKELARDVLRMLPELEPMARGVFGDRSQETFFQFSDLYEGFMTTFLKVCKESKKSWLN